MATKKTAPTLRRCIGSTRFGIEPHEAPVAEFPKQPSRKDGLGLMCMPHSKAYVRGLREARAAAAGTSNAEKAPAVKATTERERRRTPMAHLPADEARKLPSRANRLASRNRAKASELAPEVAKAEALIAEVDALPGPEHVKRVGDDVQAALETLANGGGTETPLGEAIGGGTEEADAA